MDANELGKIAKTVVWDVAKYGIANTEFIGVAAQLLHNTR